VASRFPGLSSIQWGSSLTNIGTGASNTDTLDKTYQINEKLTWLKGRHSLKTGGQLLHYVQQRTTPATTGRSAFSATAGRSPACVLRLPAGSGHEQGTRQRLGALDAPPQPDRALRPGRLQVFPR
jgi:hypothetical protein